MAYTPNVSRIRADSLGSLSMRGPPNNTPDAESNISANLSLNLDKVNEDLALKADISFGEPTLVPENTPAQSPLNFHFKFKHQDLPQIDEVLDSLEPCSGTSVLSSTAHSLFDSSEGTLYLTHWQKIIQIG